VNADSQDPTSVWHPSHRAAIAVIGAIRRDLKIRQEDLAKRLGWPRYRYAKIEGGDRHLYFPEFLAIAEGLGVDPCELLAQVLRWWASSFHGRTHVG